MFDGFHRHWQASMDQEPGAVSLPLVDLCGENLARVRHDDDYDKKRVADTVEDEVITKRLVSAAFEETRASMALAHFALVQNHPNDEIYFPEIIKKSKKIYMNFQR